jgi:hypothetical protein
MMAVGIYLTIFLVMALAIIPAGMILGWRLGRILLKWIEDEDARGNNFKRAVVVDDFYGGAGGVGRPVSVGKGLDQDRKCYIARRVQLIRGDSAMADSDVI